LIILIVNLVNDILNWFVPASPHFDRVVRMGYVDSLIMAQ
jgi:hypothetical protein